jgi:hypothetical protein
VPHLSFQGAFKTEKSKCCLTPTSSHPPPSLTTPPPHRCASAELSSFPTSCLPLKPRQPRTRGRPRSLWIFERGGIWGTGSCVVMRSNWHTVACLHGAIDTGIYYWNIVLTSIFEPCAGAPFPLSLLVLDLPHHKCFMNEAWHSKRRRRVL